MSVNPVGLRAEASGGMQGLGHVEFRAQMRCQEISGFVHPFGHGGFELGAFEGEICQGI